MALFMSLQNFVMKIPIFIMNASTNVPSGLFRHEFAAMTLFHRTYIQLIENSFSLVRVQCLVHAVIKISQQFICFIFHNFSPNFLAVQFQLSTSTGGDALKHQQLEACISLNAISISPSLSEQLMTRNKRCQCRFSRLILCVQLVSVPHLLSSPMVTVFCSLKCLLTFLFWTSWITVTSLLRLPAVTFYSKYSESRSLRERSKSHTNFFSNITKILLKHSHY